MFRFTFHRFDKVYRWGQKCFNQKNKQLEMIVAMNYSRNILRFFSWDARALWGLTNAFPPAGALIELLDKIPNTGTHPKNVIVEAFGDFHF
ncbi:hypothetical protein [uncultured Virgibacillus sp.]|uniref:hypothetical protein n=1 Tax=uncultured Virgibacillus sp. TaxID=417355 RepID=UPI0026168749|nr:hypothetical protein [uncultured Virgibacillus sp.]